MFYGVYIYKKELVPCLLGFKEDTNIGGMDFFFFLGHQLSSILVEDYRDRKHSMQCFMRTIEVINIVCMLVGGHSGQQHSSMFGGVYGGHQHRFHPLFLGSGWFI